MTRKSLVYCTGGGVVLLVLAIAIIYLPLYCNSWRSAPQIQFNADKWRSGDTKLRGTMVYDLDNRKDEMLIEKMKPAIEELLGKPGWISKTGLNWEYDVDIGQNFFGSPQMYQFSVIFNEDGVAKETALMD